jgi:hypothetical protein
VTSPRISAGEPFDARAKADLVVDRVYQGGPQPHWGADPVGRLLPVGLQSGIRFNGGRQAPRLVALPTSGSNADWPDAIDIATGTVTYYGDNRKPGSDLHNTPKQGASFCAAPSTGRTQMLRAAARCPRSSYSLRPVPPRHPLSRSAGSRRT